MEPIFEILNEKKLVGKRMIMSLLNNKTGELWGNFMRRRKEILNNIGTELYSVHLYDPLYFKNFNPDTEFEKWAAVEVTDFDSIPTNMEKMTLTGGLYAVFLYKGDSRLGQQVFRFIFETWLPNSEYSLDIRPHFELLGEKYKNEDPSSEEEIWIPVKPNKLF